MSNSFCEGSFGGSLYAVYRLEMKVTRNDCGFKVCECVCVLGTPLQVGEVGEMFGSLAHKHFAGCGGFVRSFSVQWRVGKQPRRTVDQLTH